MKLLSGDPQARSLAGPLGLARSSRLKQDLQPKGPREGPVQPGGAKGLGGGLLHAAQ